MSEALVIEGREAADLAHELAERRGVSVERAVVDSLREALSAAAGRPAGSVPGPVRVPTLKEMRPDQRARYERLQALALEGEALKKPGATSDHSDLYDEFGLPI
ncbi:type II toxin-antitoxin system VapB family antitoxin [Methylobacterium dankookense]|uniref:Uncharacterized protein n=1 Tax=Methylobacterium dankookense TaxID=560405 RepID=A0A564FWA5_9HYPH|nr:type II toxin-antitoxin system VapB family antitoxin [Methylobacterium dankookense]GJD59706.1 hypothetical protein IFDJLNFL_5637 [Methylobacterium dankookense]VUF12435.1 hypothetical protein MTDSW087_02127 [Methylobacterium dankookense]